MTEYKLEVCLDSAESAIIAERGGAARVELCDNLFGGGTTPGPGTIITTRKSVSLGLQVIIRPRPGDFCYTDVEFDAMVEDIKFCKSQGVDGVVIGILKPNGTVDIERSAQLVELAHPMNVTFHRAFDVTVDPFQALEDIIAIGCTRILTSGQEETVLEGAPLIKSLIERAKDRIIILPGGGITERKLQRIIAATGASEYHIHLDAPSPSVMDFQSGHVYMGGELRKPEFLNSYTSEQRVSRVIGEFRKC